MKHLRKRALLALVLAAVALLGSSSGGCKDSGPECLPSGKVCSANADCCSGNCAYLWLLPWYSCTDG